MQELLEQEVFVDCLLAAGRQLRQKILANWIIQKLVFIGFAPEDYEIGNLLNDGLVNWLRHI